jgi:hypothetical protein
MSWEDHCKVIFKQSVDAKYRMHRTKNKGVAERARIIKDFANKSKIPLRVLKRWYWEATHKKPLPICSNCHKNYVEIKHNCLEPPKNGKSHNICTTCQRDKYKHKSITAMPKKEEMENGKKTKNNSQRNWG